MVWRFRGGAPIFESMITLDIISDPICPWCYIGKTHLDMAIQRVGRQPFDITWRPFQLNPTMPPEGMGRREYLEAKFGKENATKFYGQIEDAAHAAGLNVRFDLIDRTPNTFDAHRLIRWSRSTGQQTMLVHQLFVRYFEKGEDISDRDLLLDAAVTIGMDRDVVAGLFERDADRTLVEEEEAAAREMGVSGVPTFIVASKHVLTGAQPPELWAQVLEELAARPDLQVEG
ncbi:MAG: DsbA family oxidoreductase [Pikeienuella sp.]